jgi:hypothetical protein
MLGAAFSALIVPLCFLLPTSGRDRQGLAWTPYQLHSDRAGTHTDLHLEEREPTTGRGRHRPYHR